MPRGNHPQLCVENNGTSVGGVGTDLLCQAVDVEDRVPQTETEAETETGTETGEGKGIQET